MHGTHMHARRPTRPLARMAQGRIRLPCRATYWLSRAPPNLRCVLSAHRMALPVPVPCLSAEARSPLATRPKPLQRS
eukprot:13898826-Alexandrium_andersonii.AAC.1